ncbi:MAG: peptidylprolyl isomerase [Ilumatobacteraceae bacterium]
MGTDKRARQKANRERARQERIRKQKMTKVRKRGILFGVGIPAIVVALFFIAQLAGGDDSASVQTTPSVSASVNTAVVVEGETNCPAIDGSQEQVMYFTSPMKKCIDETKSYVATFDTSEGEIVVDLNTSNVPGTVNNFVSLARYKYYDGSTIFRTDPSIDIIQGGGKNNTDNPGYSIPDEGGKFAYSEGDLVMARGSEPNSGGGQFFFVTGPKASLLDSQGTYVTFGKISSGLDVAKAIMALHEADDSGLGGAPSRTVTVNSITITEK